MTIAELCEVGSRFGRYVVIGDIGRDRSQYRMLCKCDCGNVRKVPKSALIKGQSKSCGCFRRDSMAARNYKHGMEGTYIYVIWRFMIRRCVNKKDKDYKNYGGRGIKVCEDWAHSFSSFYRDMGHRPTPKHSLDRIDVNRDYEPSNCRWATPREQHRNTRYNHIMTLKGRSLCIAEWAELLKIKEGTIHNRLRKGWSDESVLTVPVRAWGRNRREPDYKVGGRRDR